MTDVIVTSVLASLVIIAFFFFNKYGSQHFKLKDNTNWRKSSSVPSIASSLTYQEKVALANKKAAKALITVIVAFPVLVSVVAVFTVGISQTTPTMWNIVAGSFVPAFILLGIFIGIREAIFRSLESENLS